MPDLPSSLALTNIADGADIIASDHRNNYSTIETAVNDLITALAGGTAGQVLQAVDSDTVAYAYPPGHEYDYVAATSDVTVSGTSGSQTTVITGSAVTYDGSTAVIIEVFAPGIINGSADSVTIEVWDGSTSIGIFGQVSTGGGAQVIQVPFLARKKLTPTNAAHTYTVKAYRSSTNGTVKASTGAAGALEPAYLRITKA